MCPLLRRGTCRDEGTRRHVFANKRNIFFVRTPTRRCRTWPHRHESRAACPCYEDEHAIEYEHVAECHNDYIYIYEMKTLYICIKNK